MFILNRSFNDGSEESDEFIRVSSLLTDFSELLPF